VEGRRAYPAERGGIQGKKIETDGQVGEMRVREGGKVLAPESGKEGSENLSSAGGVGKGMPAGLLRGRVNLRASGGEEGAEDRLLVSRSAKKDGRGDISGGKRGAGGITSREGAFLQKGSTDEGSMGRFFAGPRKRGGST